MTAFQQREEERAMDVFLNVFGRFTDDLGDKELKALTPLLQSPVWQKELARIFQAELEYRTEMAG